MMEPGALTKYRAVIDAVGKDGRRFVLSSRYFIIDSQGRKRGEGDTPEHIWHGAPAPPALARAAGVPVLELDANTVLHRALARLRNPFYFVSVAYPRRLWEEVEGYRGSKFISPDKGFHWRVLGAANKAFHVTTPLFCYRVHDRNQDAQQRASGALKHLVDQYTYTFELPDDLLHRAGLTREDLAAAFVREDILLRGFAAVAAGDRETARRSIRLGQAAYPRLMARNPRAAALRALLALGPLGPSLAGAARRRLAARSSWRSQMRWYDEPLT
jgi:hypothetical protein